MSYEEVIETFIGRGNIQSVVNVSIENLLDINLVIRFLQENYFESFVEVKASDLYERYCDLFQKWKHGNFPRQNLRKS